MCISECINDESRSRIIARVRMGMFNVVLSVDDYNYLLFVIDDIELN